jgi:hypothetical protein
MSRFLCLFFLLSLLVAPSCSKDKIARAMPESAKAYVYAYSHGVVSRIAPLKIQFAGVVASEEQVGTAAARVAVVAHRRSGSLAGHFG